MHRKNQYYQNTDKYQILHNLICRFNLIPIKIPASYFVDIVKLILKFICRDKRPQIANTIWKEKSKAGGLKLPNFKTYYIKLQ